MLSDTAPLSSGTTRSPGIRRHVFGWQVDDTRKAVIGKQKPPIAVDQRQPKWQVGKQLLDMTERRPALDPPAFIIDRQQQRGAVFVILDKRHMQQPDRKPAPPFAFEKDAALFIHPHERGKFPTSDILGVVSRGAHGKGGVGGANSAFRAKADGHHAACRHCPADAPGNEFGGARFDIQSLHRLKPPQKIFVAGTRRAPRGRRYRALLCFWTESIRALPSRQAERAAATSNSRLASSTCPKSGGAFSPAKILVNCIIRANQPPCPVADRNRRIAQLSGQGMGDRPIGGQHLDIGFDRPGAPHIIDQAPSANHRPGTATDQQQALRNEPQNATSDANVASASQTTCLRSARPASPPSLPKICNAAGERLIIQFGPLPDTDAIPRFEVQFAVRLRLERIVPFVKVTNDPSALGGGAVRIGDEPLTQIGLTVIAPPHLCPAQEKPLIAGKSVDYRRLPCHPAMRDRHHRQWSTRPDRRYSHPA